MVPSLGLVRLRTYYARCERALVFDGHPEWAIQQGMRQPMSFIGIGTTHYVSDDAEDLAAV